MNRDKATAVVDQLNQWGVPSAVISRGQFQAGVRVSLPDGREARWGVDRSASLEALVLRDGVLVGFVTPVAGGAELNPALTAWAIARTDYDHPGRVPSAATRARAPAAHTTPMHRGVDTLSGRLAARVMALRPRTR